MDGRSEALEEMKQAFLDKYSGFVSILSDQISDTLHEMCLEEHHDLLSSKIVSDVLISMILSDFLQ